MCMLSQFNLCGPMDCGLPDSSVHGIIPPRILEWIAITSSRESSWSISCIDRWILYQWTIWETHYLYVSGTILMYYLSQFSSSVVSDSLRSHRLQHTRLLPCPSPTPRACSNSCPLSRWCHSTISSSVIPFSSWLESFPASGSFPRVSSSHQVAKVLEFQLQHQSFQWIFGTDLL